MMGSVRGGRGARAAGLAVTSAVLLGSCSGGPTDPPAPASEPEVALGFTQLLPDEGTRHALLRVENLSDDLLPVTVGRPRLARVRPVRDPAGRDPGRRPDARPPGAAPGARLRGRRRPRRAGARDRPHRGERGRAAARGQRPGVRTPAPRHLVRRPAARRERRHRLRGRLATRRRRAQRRAGRGGHAGADPAGRHRPGDGDRRRRHACSTTSASARPWWSRRRSRRSTSRRRSCPATAATSTPAARPPPRGRSRSRCGSGRARTPGTRGCWWSRLPRSGRLATQALDEACALRGDG